MAAAVRMHRRCTPTGTAGYAVPTSTRVVTVNVQTAEACSCAGQCCGLVWVTPRASASRRTSPGSRGVAGLRSRPGARAPLRQPTTSACFTSPPAVSSRSRSPSRPTAPGTSHARWRRSRSAGACAPGPSASGRARDRRPSRSEVRCRCPPRSGRSPWQLRTSAPCQCTACVDAGSAVPNAVDAGAPPVDPPMLLSGGCQIAPAQRARSGEWLVAFAGLLFTARRRKVRLTDDSRAWINRRA